MRFLLYIIFALALSSCGEEKAEKISYSFENVIGGSPHSRILTYRTLPGTIRIVHLNSLKEFSAKVRTGAFAPLATEWGIITCDTWGHVEVFDFHGRRLFEAKIDTEKIGSIWHVQYDNLHDALHIMSIQFGEEEGQNKHFLNAFAVDKSNRAFNFKWRREIPSLGLPILLEDRIIFAFKDGQTFSVERDFKFNE